MAAHTLCKRRALASVVLALAGTAGALAAWAQSPTLPGGPAAASAAAGGGPVAASAAPRAALRTLRITEAQGATHATVVGDSLWEIVGAATSGAAIDRNQAMVAVLRRNPQAFPAGNLHRIERGLVLVIPPLREMRLEDPRRAAELVQQHRVAYLNRAIATMPPYPLAAASAGEGAAAAPGSPRSDAVASAPPPALRQAGPEAPDAALLPEPARTGRDIPWLAVVMLVALGGSGVWLLVRRRDAHDLGADPQADATQASRAFADSRLLLEDQLESQFQQQRDSRLGDSRLEAESRPLYASFEDDEAGPAPAQDVAGRARVGKAATLPLVQRLDEGAAPGTVAADRAEAPGKPASGEALALALTIAHAYADVGRPEAARHWLRAIDSRGGVSF